MRREVVEELKIVKVKWWDIGVQGREVKLRRGVLDVGENVAGQERIIGVQPDKRS